MTNEEQIPEEEQEQVFTEVTSISEEEEKLGKPIMNMTAEQLVERAASNIPPTLNRLERMMQQMSSKQIRRAIIGALDLPQAGLPVPWMHKPKGKHVQPKPGYENTVESFLMIQRLLSDRFILIQKHVIDEAKAHRTKQEAELAKKESEEVKESNDSTDKDNGVNELTTGENNE